MEVPQVLSVSKPLLPFYPHRFMEDMLNNAVTAINVELFPPLGIPRGNAPVDGESKSVVY
jgi:hypothetical protein